MARTDTKNERLGLSFVNKYGELYTITKYNNANDIEVTFENGCIVHTAWRSCKDGNTRSPYAKTVFGVGFFGEGKHKSRLDGNSKQTKEYCLWKRMMQRCYDKTELERHPTYGKCKVYTRWHNFQLFCEDLPKIENYELWLNNNGYSLDKDLKQQDLEYKIYSLETCIFIKNEDNLKEMLQRTDNNKIKVISIDLVTGEQKEYDSITDASKITGLNISAIHKCCHNSYGKRINVYDNKKWFFKGENKYE